jgi:hypothetical protein
MSTHQQRQAKALVAARQARQHKSPTGTPVRAPPKDDDALEASKDKRAQYKDDDDGSSSEFESDGTAESFDDDSSSETESASASKSASTSKSASMNPKSKEFKPKATTSAQDARGAQGAKNTEAQRQRIQAQLDALRKREKELEDSLRAEAISKEYEGYVEQEMAFQTKSAKSGKVKSAKSGQDEDEELQLALAISAEEARRYPLVSRPAGQVARAPSQFQQGQVARAPSQFQQGQVARTSNQFPPRIPQDSTIVQGGNCFILQSGATVHITVNNHPSSSSSWVAPYPTIPVRRDANFSGLL